MLWQKARFEEAQFLSPFEDPNYGFWDNNPCLEYLKKWIVRHLDKPYLAVWMAEKDMPIEKQLKNLIIMELEKTERKPSSQPRSYTPNDPPINELMRKVWELFLTDSITQREELNRQDAWYMMADALERNGVSPSVILEINIMLKPTLYLESLHSNYNNRKNESAKNIISDMFNFHIDIGRERFPEEIDIDNFLEKTSNAEITLEELIFFLNLFNDALTNMFNLVKWVCGNSLDSRLNDEFKDVGNSYAFKNWIALVQNLQKLWLYIAEKDKEKALNILDGWQTCPHLVFHRLSLLCIIKNCDYFDFNYVFKLLIANEGYLLRSTYPEVVTLLKKFASQFNETQHKHINSLYTASAKQISPPNFL